MKLTKKKRILIIVLALIVAAVAATAIVIIKKQHDFYSPMVDTTIRFDKNYIPPDEAEDVFEISDAQPEPIARNEKLAAPIKANPSAFIEALSAEKISYDYTEFFDTETAFSQQKALPKVTKHKYDITNGSGKIDQDALYEAVIKNNDAYFASFQSHGKDSDGQQLFEEAPEKQIRLACKYITKYVNQAAKSKQWRDVDFERVYCNLATLRVMHGTNVDFSLAYVNEENILSINEAAITGGKIFVPLEYEDWSEKQKEQYMWDNTMVHEVMHLLQSPCPCIEGKDDFWLGNMCMPASQNTSPLVIKWLVEASAELEKCNMLQNEPFTYSNYINYYYSLLCAFAVNPDTSAKQIMRATYDKDNYPFYKAYGDLDKEQSIELLSALYSIEVMNYMPMEFLNQFEENTGIDLNDAAHEDALELVNQKLRVNALKCFTKNFYLSLAKQVTQGKMSYNDMFYLIRMFERAIYEHQLFNAKDRLMTSNAFFDYYLEVQNNFFEAIANNDFSKDDIISAFEAYTPECKVEKKTVDNFDLSWMNAEQSNAVQKILSNYTYLNLPTIRAAKQIYVENGYDKALWY